MKMINLRTKKVIVEKLELADSFSSRLIGLLGRSQLPKGQGLLIRRSGNSIHTLFMKFAIDLVFLNKSGIVKYIKQDLKPWRVCIAPTVLVRDCLELPAGTVKSHDLKKGDRLSVET